MKKKATSVSSKKLIKKLEKKLNKKKFNKGKMSRKKLLKKQRIIDKKINTKIELMVLKGIEEIFTNITVMFVLVLVGLVVKFFVDTEAQK